MAPSPRARASRSAMAAAVALASIAGHAPAAPIFYGVTGSTLVRLDMGAQTATLVGTLQVGATPLTVMEDCDFDAAGQLWAMRHGNAGGFPPVTASQAYQVNIATGDSVAQGNYGTAAAMQSLAFRALNSSFYSVNLAGSGANGHLVTSDLVAGTITSVAGVPHGLNPLRVEALAFGQGLSLYGIFNANTGGPFGTNDYRLISFNVATGLATSIGSIAPNPRTFNSLRFDDAGTAYTVDSLSGDVFTVNLVTGQGTFLFAGGPAAVGTRGLAFIPAPGATALLGLGALLAARRRRR